MNIQEYTQPLHLAAIDLEAAGEALCQCLLQEMPGGEVEGSEADKRIRENLARWKSTVKRHERIIYGHRS